VWLAGPIKRHVPVVGPEIVGIPFDRNPRVPGDALSLRATWVALVRRRGEADPVVAEVNRPDRRRLMARANPYRHRGPCGGAGDLQPRCRRRWRAAVRGWRRGRDAGGEAGPPLPLNMVNKLRSARPPCSLIDPVFCVRRIRRFPPGFTVSLSTVKLNRESGRLR